MTAKRNSIQQQNERKLKKKVEINFSKTNKKALF